MVTLSAGVKEKKRFFIPDDGLVEAFSKSGEFLRVRNCVKIFDVQNEPVRKAGLQLGRKEAVLQIGQKLSRMEQRAKRPFSEHDAVGIQAQIEVVLFRLKTGLGDLSAKNRLPDSFFLFLATKSKQVFFDRLFYDSFSDRKTE